jgi:hypothetical protein
MKEFKMESIDIAKSTEITKSHPPTTKTKTNGHSSDKVELVSAPSDAPAAKTSTTLDRTKFTDPDLARPVAERQTSKQTIIPIRKSKEDFFRIHPSSDTRLDGVTVLVSKSNKPKVLTTGVSQETRRLLPRSVLKRVDLYLACDERGSYFVIYLSATEHENAESWVESGLIVVKEAEREWISIEANMNEGGYRITYAKDKFPKLAASKPRWDLAGEDDPVSLFNHTLTQNCIDNDNSPAIQKFLEARQ